LINTWHGFGGWLHTHMRMRLRTGSLRRMLRCRRTWCPGVMSSATQRCWYSCTAIQGTCAQGAQSHLRISQVPYCARVDAPAVVVCEQGAGLCF
jgi:hypothetical protein